jgi:IclR family transcriptional regulator, acetate operon repressor
VATLTTPPTVDRYTAVPETASVLERILAILDVVRESGPSISITDLAARTHLPKSTVSRLVAALVEQRYLARTEHRVALGLRLFELGSRASIPRQLRAVAAPIARDLWEATGERVGLWVYHGTDMVSVAVIPGRLPMLPSRAGTRSPALTTASGKAFLAFCSDERIVDHVSGHLRDDAAEQFRTELSEVRASSVALDPGVADPGIVAVASPLISSNRMVVGAISVAGPSGSMDADLVTPLVHAAGATLSRRLAAA